MVIQPDVRYMTETHVPWRLTHRLGKNSMFSPQLKFIQLQPCISRLLCHRFWYGCHLDSYNIIFWKIHPARHCGLVWPRWRCRSLPHWPYKAGPDLETLKRGTKNGGGPRDHVSFYKPIKWYSFTMHVLFSKTVIRNYCLFHSFCYDLLKYTFHYKF